ncbi:M48 family metalloprotease [Planosporangium sp. 12N6]|uniref:M48 family metallopeptidase n=1 Tax=Planosporangium spinosum TaxID=3402278 RepID=UPI003CEA6EB0
MVTTVRAAVSAALLAGFYVLAFGVVAGLGWVAVWLWREHPGAAAGKLSFLVLALAAGIVVALWKVVTTRPEPPDGVVVDERQAPELWAGVRELAAVVRTRVPDEIRLVAEVNAAVTEDSRLLGLRAGRRYLYIGVPLLQALTVDQVRAVLAHELGHYSHSHTRLGALTYRGKAAIVHTIAQVGPKTLAGRLFGLYARLYFLVSLAVSRRMELEADRAAVRAGGSGAAAGALRELPVISAAWGFYLNNYVGWGLDSGHAPTGVLDGFGRMLAARGDELAQLREKAPDEERSRWDSHPPVGARVAVIEREPAVPDSGDRRPAVALVPLLPELLDAIERSTFDFGDRVRVPFEEYTARAMRMVHQRDADTLYRVAARIAGVSRSDLDTVLDLIEAGRGGELGSALRPGARPEPRADAAALGSALESALAVAVERAGAGRWQHSWSQSATLVGRDGSALDLTPLVAAAVGGPAGAAELRARLHGWGVDTAVARAEQTAATAVGAEVVAAVSDLKSADGLYDVLVFSTGLQLVPSPGKKHHEQAKRRLYKLAAETAPAELAARAGGRFLAFEDIATARLAKRVPVTFEVTMRDGGTVTLRQSLHSEELGEGFKALGGVVGAMGRDDAERAGAAPDAS